MGLWLVFQVLIQTLEGKGKIYIPPQKEFYKVNVLFSVSNSKNARLHETFRSLKTVSIWNQSVILS